MCILDRFVTDFDLQNGSQNCPRSNAGAMPGATSALDDPKMAPGSHFENLLHHFECFLDYMFRLMA